MGVTLNNGVATITIRPELGAGLTGYDVLCSGEWLPIFRRVSDTTAHPFALSNILLAPFSGRVSGGGFTFDGTFYAIERNMPTEEYPIHGSAFSSAWMIAEHTADAIALTLRCDGPGPFRYDAHVIYRLEGLDLVMELTITNRASIRLPYGAGFHPWFVRDQQTYLTANATRVWLESDDHLPRSIELLSHHADMNFCTKRHLPSSWINNWFTGWDRKAQIDWPGRGVSVEVEASKDLCQYVVFSPSSEADFFCFEPVSHPVDAFNPPEGPEAHGMKILDPGAELRVQMVVRPRKSYC